MQTSKNQTTPIPTLRPVTTIVDLLRHGQPTSEGCLAGHYDAALTETGWQQLRQAISTPQDYQQIISSPLQRCKAFARELAEQQALPVDILPGWKEIDFGEWDGEPYASLYERYPQQLSDFWCDPWKYPPPGGEKMPAFYQRIVAAWQQLLQDHAGKKILVVSHSGVIRHLLSYILGMEPEKNLAMSRFNIPHASVTRIEIYQDEQGEQWPRVMFINAQVTV